MTLYRLYRAIKHDTERHIEIDSLDQMKRMVDDMENYMDALTQGVYLIGVKDAEKVNFMTAAWITQVSGNPKKILLAVGKKHHTAEMIRKAGKFSVNVLGAGQEELAKKCGYTSGKNTDKSKDMDYCIEDDVPVVNGTAGHLWCTLTREIDEGDHVLFIGNVKSGEKKEAIPLIYHEKEY
ncbi:MULTISPECIES: flavin reductase family protein [Mediterraneibacter]|jgi:flavin reductase (DIM6/NTAB) family NADH-FMN oxidoreductase RutF|uniref:flavin reductase family protein n=1 Tax=Mediterraneibacter TaxID=2316020 RepID=UPI000E4D50C7|nr:flavin reductase family protein [Mediterraneibacter massiliensis]RGT72405.1 flavin reductase family protein [Ruminococcus sp. AF18-22]